MGRVGVAKPGVWGARGARTHASKQASKRAGCLNARTHLCDFSASSTIAKQEADASYGASRVIMRQIG